MLYRERAGVVATLVVLGLIIALGRYTGMRLSELLRFRALAAEGDKP